MTESKMEQKFVTKDMIIGDVLKKYPDVAVVMLENGLHCVGCHANVFDTIDAGSRLHGLDDETINQMVDDMNAFIAQNQKEAPPSTKTAEPKVTITDGAAKKIKELLEKDDLHGHGLRVSVLPGGCSGFVYQMNFEPKAEESDLTLEDKGISLFVDKESIELLSGAEIDYVDTLNESGFKINNPNAKHGCGCGKSFG